MATEDDNLDSGGTFESGMEQGVVTKDNVTKEGESGNTTGIDPLSGNMIEGGQESSTSGNSQSIDSNPSEPKSGLENPLCKPSDSGTLSQSDGSEIKLGSDYVHVGKPKSGKQSPSSDPGDSATLSETCISSSNSGDFNIIDSNTEGNMLTETSHAPVCSHSIPLHETETNQKPERGEENILQGKLFSLNLSKEDVNFLLEQGDKFLQRSPLLLARKLNIHVDKAKLTIEVLKCFKSEKTTNSISEDDRTQIENCLSENPEFSTPEDISLLSEIPLEVVTLYLQNRPLDDKQKTDIKKKVDIGNSVQEIAILLRLSPKKVQEYLDNLRNRPLDDKQKADIKEKVDIGNSVQEIAILLRLSPKKVQEYVESTFLTFTCEEGRKCLEIILKTFGDFSTNELRRLVISNDLKLQNKLCYILLKLNKEDYNQLRIYFTKFEESKSFFNINTDLTIEDIDHINQSSDVETSVYNSG